MAAVCVRTTVCVAASDLSFSASGAADRQISADPTARVSESVPSPLPLPARRRRLRGSCPPRAGAAGSCATTVGRVHSTALPVAVLYSKAGTVSRMSLIFDFVFFSLYFSHPRPRNRHGNHGRGTDHRPRCSVVTGVHRTAAASAQAQHAARSPEAALQHLYNVIYKVTAIAVSYRAYKAANKRVWCCAQSKG